MFNEIISAVDNEFAKQCAKIEALELTLQLHEKLLGTGGAGSSIDRVQLVEPAPVCERAAANAWAAQAVAAGAPAGDAAVGERWCATLGAGSDQLGRTSRGSGGGSSGRGRRSSP